VVKSLSGHVKLRSAGITSGVKLKIQKESLASPVDILVSTPGRFLQHFEAGTTSSRFPLSSPGGACKRFAPS
jgi:superfamily II DNA/RNA helicase